MEKKLPKKIQAIVDIVKDPTGQLDPDNKFGKVQEIDPLARYKEKRISCHEVEAILHKYIQESDADELCATIDHVFGVQSDYDPETEELVMTPDAGYGGMFGVFQENVKFTQEPCKCGKLFNPDNDAILKEECICGIRKDHWHCSQCGGLKEDAF